MISGECHRLPASEDHIELIHAKWQCEQKQYVSIRGRALRVTRNIKKSFSVFSD